MSLKAKLSVAQPRTAEHRLRIEDDRAARAELAAALTTDDQERVAVARATLDACYETLLLTAMAAEDWDDLLTAHPPTGSQRERGGWCNPITLLPPALVACVRDSDVEEQDWRQYLATGGPIGPGEALALFDDLVRLHERSPDPAVPKGLTGNPS